MKIHIPSGSVHTRAPCSTYKNVDRSAICNNPKSVNNSEIHEQETGKINVVNSYNATVYRRSEPPYPERGQIVNILGFVSRVVSVTTTHLSQCSANIPYATKQAVGSTLLSSTILQ